MTNKGAFFSKPGWQENFDLAPLAESVPMPNFVFMKYRFTLGVTEDQGNDTDARRKCFLTWYGTWGAAQAPFCNPSSGFFNQDWIKSLFSPSPQVKQLSSIPFPEVGFHLLGFRPDQKLDQSKNILDPEGQLNYLRWLYFEWPREIGYPINEFINILSQKIGKFYSWDFTVGDELFSTENIHISDQVDPNISKVHFMKLSRKVMYSAAHSDYLSADFLKFLTEESPI